MQRGLILAVVVAWVAAYAGRALGQYQPPAENLAIAATKAYTWPDGDSSVVMLDGPVTIDMDDSHMTANSAVVWFTQAPGVVLDQQRVEIALLGDAKLSIPNVVERGGQKLYVEGRIRGKISVTAKRQGGTQAESELYRQAAAIRPVHLRTREPGKARWEVKDQDAGPGPTTVPSKDFRPLAPVALSLKQFYTVNTPEGVVAGVAQDVTILKTLVNGDFIELRAARAVFFTPYQKLDEMPVGQQIKRVEQALTGVYLEGDVRITQTPHETKKPDQTLNANRAYYDFTTDRAVLTDVVLHTVDPKSQVPIVVRARSVKQLSDKEFTAENAQVTTSTFNTPSYSIGAAKTYVRTEDTGSELGPETRFRANDATFRLGGVPVFYFPVVSGTVNQRNALRQAEIVSSSGLGYGARTEWGLFESIGKLPPKDVDATYKLDYFSKRGPATGFDASYAGGSISETTLQPWSFSGDFTSYILSDNGEDHLGANRLDVDPDKDIRGRFYWRHQHFLPGDWQVQLTGGYISDPTFMEEWFDRQFRTGAPLDTSLYVKRQRDSEAFTFLVSIQPNDFATSADAYQEQAEVERLPELSYRRIGDSLWDDRLTFFSANTLSVLQFKNSSASLDELGFPKGDLGGNVSPGLPSYGQTGTPEDNTFRGDFRQELDWPFSVGQFKAVPYVMGRYTAYSESVDGGQIERLYAGTGLRLSTAFWRVDDSVQSDLFDMHRLRHVIEPEANFYTSAQSKDRNDLLLYDEPIDAINDITAIQLAVTQRWQTKRGGPGRWRSVDAFRLRLEANYFLSQPPDRELDPTDFRGLFFVSMPEASLPRNGYNADFEWRISDAVSILSDASFNQDETMLATAAVGLRVQQDPRIGYYIGLRHIGLNVHELVNGNTFTFDDQDLLILAGSYQLTSKYTLSGAYSYDIAQRQTHRAVLSLVREFDRFFVSVSLRVDKLEDENAVFFNLWPQGLEPGGGSAALQGAFEN